MIRLLSYLKYYKKESILGPLFKLLEALFELIVPLIVAAMIDRGIQNGDRDYIIRSCLLLVGLAVVGLISAVTAQYFAAKAAAGFATRLRRALFVHIGRLSFSQRGEMGTDTLITRLTGDLTQMQTGVNLTLRLLLRSPFIVVGATIMAFTVDFKAALIFTLVIPVLAAVVFGVMLASGPLYRRTQQRLDTLLGKTRENLEGTRVIRAFCKEEAEKEDFGRKNDSLLTAQLAAGRVSALMNPITFTIINLAVCLLIYTGGLRVQTGIITTGAVVALYNYMAQILVELIKLASLIITVTKSVASGRRIRAVLDIVPDMTEGTRTAGEPDSDYMLTFENVSFRYSDGAEDMLSHIDFKIKKGGSLGIIGGTGSGKSTLIHLIDRFYDVSAGCVKIDGVDVRDYTFAALRGKIGIVPQKAVLFKGSIRENLLWGDKNATDEALLAALEAAQAKEFALSKPGGLDFPVEQEGRNLSGGQRQRLTIARALVRRPEILILDDSSSALDYATDAALRRALGKTDFAPTVITVSQRASSVRFCDVILALDEGAAAGFGSSDELLESCALYREIYETQYQREGDDNGNP